MWKKYMKSLMTWLVSSSLILFQHLFFLIPAHRIHSYQVHLLIKMDFKTETIGCPLKVSSPGGEMIVNFGCHGLVIEFGKYKFLVSLIILDSKGLDIILGM